MSNRSTHLCVCLSPLHVLIARRIAESQGSEFSNGVYLTSTDNEKHQHYANEMNEFCSRSEYLVLPREDVYRGPKHFSILMQRIKHRMAFRRFGPVETIYVPSSINHYLFAMISAVGFERLVTFDDGLLNIQPNSLLLARTRLRKKLFYLAAGISYWPERIQAIASRHYSIYEMKNFCRHVVRIGLLNDSGPAAGQAIKTATKKIFLGPAPEASPDVWKSIRSAVRRLNVDAYLPHPREGTGMVDGVDYLEIPLVAEDYVLGQLRENPGLLFQIYGCESSALLNLAGTPRIEVFSILEKTAETAEMHSLMEKGGVVMLV